MFKACIVAVAFILLGSTGSFASSSCMTLRQARAEHPGAYLSWRGDHCWYSGSRSERSERRHARHHSRPDPEPEIKPVPVPLPVPRRFMDDIPAPQDAGAGAPAVEDLPSPQANIVTRWPEMALQERLQAARALAPPVEPEQRSMTAVYLAVLVILLMAVFAHLYGDEALAKLSQRQRLLGWDRPQAWRIEDGS